MTKGKVFLDLGTHISFFGIDFPSRLGVTNKKHCQNMHERYVNKDLRKISTYAKIVAQCSLAAKL